MIVFQNSETHTYTCQCTCTVRISMITILGICFLHPLIVCFFFNSVFSLCLSVSLSLSVFPLVVDFFNRINLIYGTVCEFCTEATCPVMSGGPK